MKLTKSARNGLFPWQTVNCFQYNTTKCNFWSKDFRFSSTNLFLFSFTFYSWIWFCFAAKSKGKSASSKKKSLTNLKLRHKVSKAITEVLDDLTESIAATNPVASSGEQFSSGQKQSVTNSTNTDTPKTRKSGSSGLLVYTRQQLCCDKHHQRMIVMQVI